MGLESATFLNQLVISNPDGLDDQSQGDDHIRLVKKVLQNTFPNITGAVTVTQDQLNAVGLPGKLAFPGMIVMWSGSVASIPTGWKLCNGTGTISTGAAVPNLVSRMIIGSGTDAGGTYNIGSTGGSITVTVGGTTGGTALTVNQIPSHNHRLLTYDPGAGTSRPLDTDGAVNGTWKTTNSDGASVIEATGGGQAHTHPVALTGNNLPPYFALAFIIKD